MAIDAMSRTLCVKAAAINGTRENNQISSANNGDTINHLQLILYAKQWGPVLGLLFCLSKLPCTKPDGEDLILNQRD
jgi:hypothetical protein